MTIVYYWSGDYPSCKEIGYEHKGTYGEDANDIAKKIYNIGLNVLVKHGPPGVDIVLVDQGGFRQQ